MSESRAPYGVNFNQEKPTPVIAGPGGPGGTTPQVICDSEAALAATMMFNSIMGRFQDMDLEVTNRRIAHSLRVLRQWFLQDDIAS